MDIDRRTWTRALFPLLVAGLLLSTAACGGGGGGSSDDTAPVIPASTQVLDDTAAARLAALSDDGATLTFTAASAGAADPLADLAAGDVLVVPATELAPDGLLRRVTSVRTDPDTGEVVVETEQATLTDAIEQGVIDFSQPLTADDLEEVVTLHEGVSATGTVSALSVAPAAGGSIGLSIDDTLVPGVRFKGDVTLSLTPTFSAKIRSFTLKSLTAKLTASEEAGLRVIGEYAFEASKDKKVGELRFRPVLVWVGYVPVYLRPVVEVHIGVKGEVESTATTSVSQSLSYTAGVQYDGDWSVINDLEKSFTYEPPSLEAKAGVKGYLQPKLVFYIYGVGGPFAGVDGYLSLTADLNETPWCDLSAGIDGTAGITGEILSVDLGSVEKQLFDLSVSLYQCSRPYLTASPATDIYLSGPEGGPFTPQGGSYELKAKDGAVDWSAAANVAWLDLSELVGSLADGATRKVDVAVNSNADLLAPGTYTGTVELKNTTNGEGDTKRYVILSVRERSMGVTPGPDAYILGSAPEGGDFSGLATQTFTVVADAGSVDWQVTGAPSWLTVSPSSGSVTEGSPVTVTVAVDAEAAKRLPAALQSATLTFENRTNGKGDTTRTLFVQPTMPVSPTAWAVAGPEGGPFEGQETFRIEAVNRDTPWTATTDAEWIHLSATSGTAPEGGASEVVASIDTSAAAALDQGEHTATITFTNTASGDASDETEVPVTLTVKEPLQVSPSQLTLSGPPGGPFTASPDGFDVSSEVAVDYEVSADAAWLTLSPTSGSLAAGGSATVAVAANDAAASLAEGSYTATVTFTKTTGTAKSVTRPVTLTVSSTCNAGPTDFPAANQTVDAPYDMSWLDFTFDPDTGACAFTQDFTGILEFSIQESASQNKRWVFAIDALGNGWYFESVDPSPDYRSPYSKDRSLAYLDFETDTVVTLVHQDASGNVLGRYQGTFVVHNPTPGPAPSLEVRDFQKLP